MVVVSAWAAGGVRAGDWPQLLGPTQDAVYAGPALAAEWPADGPKVVWRLNVGEGYSSPVVSGGRVIQAHREADDLVVDCLNALTGARHWAYRQPMKFKDGANFDHGPRPTPAIGGGRVFVHNTDGALVCLDLGTGEKKWSRRPKSEFQSSATWHGCAASPVLTDRAVVLVVGGTNQGGIVAFSRDDGKILWQVTDEKASASTPVLATIDGQAQLIAVTRSAMHGLDPATGRDFWRWPTRRQTSGDVYAASPLVVDGGILLTGWYKLGAAWLGVKGGEPTVRWHRDDALSAHYASPLVWDGHLYGFHGHAWERGGPNLRCVELATGRMVWEEAKVGSGTLVRVPVRSGDRTETRLLILSDTGELQLASASPKEFRVRHRAQVVGRTTRSYPALADGYAYIKGPRQLVCVDLRSGEPGR